MRFIIFSYFYAAIFTLAMEHVLLWHVLPLSPELASCVKFYIKTFFRLQIGN